MGAWTVTADGQTAYLYQNTKGRKLKIPIAILTSAVLLTWFVSLSTSMTLQRLHPPSPAKDPDPVHPPTQTEEHDSHMPLSTLL